MSFLRRLRGVAGTAVTWATSWGLLGAGLHAFALLMGWNGFLSNAWSMDILGHAAMGLLGGGVFSAGLLLTERGRSLQNLSIVRSAIWGALAGLGGATAVFAILGGIGALPDLWMALVAGAGLGMGGGAGMSALARSSDVALPGTRETDLLEQS